MINGVVAVPVMVLLMLMTANRSIMGDFTIGGWLWALGWLSSKHTLQIDWTAGHRNTLTEASRKQLASMPDPLAFNATRPVVSLPSASSRLSYSDNSPPWTLA